GDEREHRVEVAVVDVQVGAAHPHLLHADAHLAPPDLGHGDVRYGKTTWGVIENCPHDVLSFVVRRPCAAVRGDHRRWKPGNPWDEQPRPRRSGGTARTRGSAVGLV